MTTLRGRAKPTVRTSTLALELGGSAVPVEVVRSARRRRTIAVGIGASGVRVQAPMSTTDAAISSLLRSRAGWIRDRLAARSSVEPSRPLEDGAEIPYRGRTIPLRVTNGGGPQASVSLQGEMLSVQVPGAVVQPGHTALVRSALLRWYHTQAVDVLPSMVNGWGEVMGMTPSRVLVRNQRRRWGSCAPDGAIRLNWRLILLEPSLAEYVVVHELAHLRHRNHQAGFWAEVARFLPDHRERRRRLNASRALDYFAD